MPTALKVEKFSGIARTAPEAIEKNEMEQQLRAALFVCDAHLRDLNNEFAAREAKIKQEYLDRVNQITQENELEKLTAVRLRELLHYDPDTGALHVACDGKQ